VKPEIGRMRSSFCSTHWLLLLLLLAESVREISLSTTTY